MGIEQELARIATGRATLVSIGVFDGVHAGHRHLLERLRLRAEQEALTSAVVTFNPHPQSVMRPGDHLPWLSELDERVRLLRGLGIELVVVLTFTPEVARLSASEFMSLLRQHLKMRGIMVGPDFGLGRGREGDIRRLRELGREMGFSVESVPPYTIDGEVVSSTLIRQALAQGDTEKVNRLMGRYFHVAGRVISSDKRGRTLGFPTANLDIKPQQALPGDAVYATITQIDDGQFPSATSIGTRPTFGPGKKVVETYVLDYQGDLYGNEIRVEFVRRLRGQRRFRSVEELKAQMEKDVRAVEAFFARGLI